MFVFLNIRHTSRLRFSKSYTLPGVWLVLDVCGSTARATNVHFYIRIVTIGTLYMQEMHVVLHAL